MLEQDILLLFTHGALTGLGAKATLLDPATMAKQVVDVAKATVKELKAAGYKFDGGSDSPAEPPSPGPIPGINIPEPIVTPVASPVAPVNYDPSSAPNPNTALELAVQIRLSPGLQGAHVDQIKMFQNAAGLKIDGIVGPHTIAAFNYWLMVHSTQTTQTT